MNYTKETDHYLYSTSSEKYTKKIYSDFFCSMKNWHELLEQSEQVNFINQLINKIYLDKIIPEEFVQTINYADETYHKVTLLGGDVISDELSVNIIKQAIKLVIKEDVNVGYFSTKDKVCHIELTLPYNTMPNLVLLLNCPLDDLSTTNYVIYSCLDAIYTLLDAKVSNKDAFDKYLKLYYNPYCDAVFCKYLKGKNELNNWTTNNNIDVIFEFTGIKQYVNNKVTYKFGRQDFLEIHLFNNFYVDKFTVTQIENLHKMKK